MLIVLLIAGLIALALIALILRARTRRGVAGPAQQPLTDEQAAAEHARPYVHISVAPIEQQDDADDR